MHDNKYMTTVSLMTKTKLTAYLKNTRFFAWYSVWYWLISRFSQNVRVYNFIMIFSDT